MPTAPLAHDRTGHGSPDALPMVLLHAGVADRRMWDGVRDLLAPHHEVVRLDLRGFGDSTSPPEDDLVDHVGDVLATLAALGIPRCHLVGASMGAGVAVEAALDHPGLAADLVLLAPGGSLFADWTPQLRGFATAERAALAAGDLDAATEVNLRWWVDGPGQPATRVDAAVREQVRVMQRHAFATQGAWPGDPDEAEPDLPPTERLGELAGTPLTVLSGDLDLDAVQVAATTLASGVADARHVRWAHVAHLPALEDPSGTSALITEHLLRVG